MNREEEILEYSKTFKGKGMENEELKEIIRLAIIDGALWADKHPRQGLVDIDNVCDYLDSLLYYDEHDGMLKCNFTSFDKFIEDLKKVLEE